MTERPPPSPCRPTEFVDALVAQTLDDLDEGRFDVDEAVRALAAAAWEAGCEHGIRLATRLGAGR